MTDEKADHPHAHQKANSTILYGTAQRGQGWVSINWDRMKIAHAPELDGCLEGTFNVVLPTGWKPPDDDKYSQQANQLGNEMEKSGKGEKDGTDFLKCGNYIHPKIRVTKINGVAIDGRVYYPAGFKDKGHPRTSLEILSKTKIREALGIGPRDSIDVAVMIELDE